MALDARLCLKRSRCCYETKETIMRTLSLLFIIAVATILSGCASYITPSGRADFTSFTSTTMQESFAARPAAQFPASIVAIRVQSPRYRSYSTEREGGVHGYGRYSVITVREVEDDADVQRMSKLSEVGGLIGISSLLLPESLQSDKELREAAARLKADMVFLYTFDTTFHENEKIVPLSVVTLGLSPTRTISVTVTASALLMDTRTGFIYAALEATEKRRLLTNVWQSNQSADSARRDAEKAAFKKLVVEFEKTWPQVVERTKKGA